MIYEPKIWGPSQSGVYGVVAKQGGGKSYTATMWACREILYGRRCVVANVSLQLDKMVELCEAEGISAREVYRRVRVLTQDEQNFFWRYRGPSHELVVETKELVR